MIRHLVVCVGPVDLCKEPHELPAPGQTLLQPDMHLKCISPTAVHPPAIQSIQQYRASANSDCKTVACSDCLCNLDTAIYQSAPIAMLGAVHSQTIYIHLPCVPTSKAAPSSVLVSTPSSSASCFASSAAAKVARSGYGLGSSSRCRCAHEVLGGEPAASQINTFKEPMQ